jgi:putative Mn2+ efflux pump MntP
LAAGALKVIAVAVALSLDVFAVSLGAGVRGVPPRVKLRMGLAFACAEIAMNVIGALLGVLAGRVVGGAAAYLGFAVLAGLGAYMLRESAQRRGEAERFDLSGGWGLVLAAFSLSFDSLGVGFSILYLGVPVAMTLAVVGGVSVGATALGLALGERIGRYAGRGAAVLGGMLLMLTGIAFIVLKALGLQ